MTEMTHLLFELADLEVGRTYKCMVDRERGLALAPTEKRGRPRAISGHLVLAARALDKAGYSLRMISTSLNVSIGAVRTALGRPR